MPHKLAATFWDVLLSKMSKLVRIFRHVQLRFLEELETGKFGRGGTRDTGLVTVDNLFENPARYIYRYIFLSINYMFLR